MAGTKGRVPWIRAGRRWSLSLLLFAALALAAFAAGTRPDTANVHAAIFDWSNANPGDDVPVVIQTNGDLDEVARIVRDHGGTAGQRFGMISAIEAGVPRGSLLQVAAHSSVHHISLDAPVVSTGFFDSSSLDTVYPFVVGATEAWTNGFTGEGVGVAVVDTGVSSHADFADSDGSRIVAEVAVNPNATGTHDGFGHGTHVAGIAGGNASTANGDFIGVAPEIDLINVKLADDEGKATLADLIAGLEWVYKNREQHNIRALNLSLHSSVAESYLLDPVCAAVEVLWFSGVFVVAASGNSGGVPDYCPANDPFVMTVGATDDEGTPDLSDDSVTSWTSRGVTADGFVKPEVYAPGQTIVSTAAVGSILYEKYPANVKQDVYMTLSGTSMSAPMVAGVAALTLQAHPDWSPGEVKCTIVDTSRELPQESGALVPSAAAAIARAEPMRNCDVGIQPSRLLPPAPFVAPLGMIAHVVGSPDPQAKAKEARLDLKAVADTATPDLESIDWGGIQWNGIQWDAIQWNAIQWDAIQWHAIQWDAIQWDAIQWDAIQWNGIQWNAIQWDGIQWDAIQWSAVQWDAIQWDAIQWDGIQWDAIQWDAIQWNGIQWDGIQWNSADELQ